MNSSDKASLWKRKSKVIMQQKRHQKTTKEDKKITSSCKVMKKRYGLVPFHELPEYMKDNEYILRYYRAEWPLSEALFSLFRWHNETLNVWTHLIGFLIFFVLTMGNARHVNQVADFITIFTRHFSTGADANISHSSNNYFLGWRKQIELKQDYSKLQLEVMSAADTTATIWPFFVFLSGSMFCLLSSSICHLFSCHSHHLNLKLLQMDYIGIAVMIITSFFPPIYYIFQCSPHWQIAYLTGITILGVSTIMTLLSPALSTGKYRPFRALLFVSMGLFGLIPAIHAVVVNWTDPYRDITLAYEFAMALSYLTGTVFYISQIPERWRPGWFDLAGQSHQIFHAFVVLGAFAHYCAAQIFLDHHGNMGCDKNL